MDLAQPLQMPRSNGEMAKYGNDSGLYVEFENYPIHMEALSAEEGRPIYHEFEYIKIQPLGQNKTVVFRRVEEDDKFRFAQKYAQFKNQQAQTSEGTPVTEWAIITKSQALEFKGMGVHTIEDVSNLSDQAIMQFLGGHKLREQARAFLAQAKDGSALTSLQKENQDLRADLEALKADFKRMGGEETEPVRQKRAYNKKGVE